MLRSATKFTSCERSGLRLDEHRDAAQVFESLEHLLASAGKGGAAGTWISLRRGSGRIATERIRARRQFVRSEISPRPRSVFAQATKRARSMTVEQQIVAH